MKILILILLQTGLAYNGMVSHVQGVVTILSSGNSSKAKMGSKINAGDSVKTGAESVAVIIMSDSAVMKLNENSELVVPEHAENELTLKAGSLFSKIPKQSPNQEFKIRTATAVAGVRGTQFFTSYGPDQRSNSDVWLCVNEGSVEVTSLAKQKKILVKEGEGVLVPSGKDVTPPQKYEWTKELNWKMDASEGDIYNKATIDYKQKLLKEEYD